MSMDAIIPLMPEPGHIVAAPAAAGALKRLFEAVRSATGLGRVLAVGQDESLLALAEQSGLSAVLLAAPQPLRPAGLLPPGGVEALERLAADGRRALLVSCDNPLLTPGIIDAFVRRALALDRPLLSVTHPVDHPCQLSQHLRIRASGVVLPLDRHEPESGGRLLTRPFRFLWMAQQTRGQGPCYALSGAADEAVLLSVSDQADQAPLPASGPLLLRESDTTARLSLPAREVRELAALFGVHAGSAIAGVGLHLSGGLPCVAFRDAAGRLSLGFAASPRPGAICQLYTRGQAHAECASALDLTGDPPRAALPGHVQGLEAPLSYNLLQCLEDDGGFDLTLRFPEDHGLWRTDPATTIQVVPATGQVIQGRQEFPEVLEAEGSLFALTKTEAANLQDLLYAGRAEPFLLEGGQSLRLRTEFDLLRYKTKLRMEAL